LLGDDLLSQDRKGSCIRQSAFLPLTSGFALKKAATFSYSKNQKSRLNVQLVASK
jgi:hypothetical protein